MHMGSRSFDSEWSVVNGEMSIGNNFTIDDSLQLSTDLNAQACDARPNVPFVRATEV